LNSELSIFSAAGLTAKKYGGFLQSRRTYFGKLKAKNNLALFDVVVRR
jgi:hypothetical protein